jgi:hypothetical protein
MKKGYLLTCAIMLFYFMTTQLSAQKTNPYGLHADSSTMLKPQKYQQKLMVGTSFAYAVINNRKEIRGQYKPGINASLYYLPRPWFAVVGEYTWYVPHISFPALENIRSWNADLNGHLNMRIGESDLFFHALFGINYLNWRGKYIGPASFFADDNSYTYGATLRQQWIGVNLGCGFNHPIGKRVTGYADFRVRFVSESVDLFSISDTGFQFGIRVNLIDETSDKDRKKMTEKAITVRESSHSRSKSKRPKGKRIYRWLKKK